MLSLGGRLWEVVANESIHVDHNGSKFFHITVWQDLTHQFREKNPVRPIQICPFLVLDRRTIILQHIIHFSHHYLSSGRLQEVKNKGKFQTFSSKSGRGRLREVVTYKRFQM